MSYGIIVLIIWFLLTVINGILLVDKSVGISSYDVIRDIKRNSKQVIDAICDGKYEDKFIATGECNSNVDKLKIGHAGTLDPFASGLMIILLGNATKKFDEFQQLKKEYVVKAELGYETATLDCTGETIKKVDNVFDYFTGEQEKDSKKIEELVNKNFVGTIEQVPPQYSAKKVNGKRAYDLVREGKHFELKSKKVTVYDFELLKLEIPFAEFRIVCSSGTYVRSLVADLGRELGCYATAVELRRTKIGEYRIDDI